MPYKLFREKKIEKYITKTVKDKITTCYNCTS